MAIIGNQAPTPPPPPPAAPSGRRVVVKLRGTPPPTAAAAAAAASTTQRLLTGLPGATVRPYFEELGAPPTTASRAAAAVHDPVFRSYVVIDPPSHADPVALARDLNGRDDVEIAYVEGGPTPPPVDPVSNPMSNNQGYLAAAR